MTEQHPEDLAAQRPADTTAPTRAAEVYSAEVEEGGENAVERAGRFAAGVLTSALGGAGGAVLGMSVVVRRRQDEEEVARVDVADGQMGEGILTDVRADLDRMSPAEFEHTWVEGTEEEPGRHVASGPVETSPTQDQPRH